MKPRRTRLAERSGPELLALVLADPPLLKRAYALLEAREPDADTARAFVEAYEGGTAPAWLVACLLTANGHGDAYPTLLAILRAGHGLLSESYAAGGMVRVRGDGATEDLRDVLVEARGPKRTAVRRATVNALGMIGTPPAITAVLDALEAKHIVALTAAEALASSAVEPALLATWLERGRPEVERAFVVKLVATRARSSEASCRRELARCAAAPGWIDPLIAELTDPRSMLSTRERAAIAAWIASIVR